MAFWAKGFWAKNFWAAGFWVGLGNDVDTNDGGTHVVRESHYFSKKKRERMRAAKAAKARKGPPPEQIAEDEAFMAEFLQAEQEHIDQLTQLATTLVGSLRIH